MTNEEKIREKARELAIKYCKDIDPHGKEIVAKLSCDFCCGNERTEILHYCKQDGLTHPAGYYDSCGENIPTSAITYWMLIPSLSEGGGE